MKKPGGKKLIATLAATLAVVAATPAGATVEQVGPPVVVGPIPSSDPSNADWTRTIDQQFTSGTSTPLLGDFNGDGLTDVFIYGAGSALDRIWLAKPFTGDREDRFTVVNISISGSYKPFVGDFDGNGVDDIFLYAPGPAADSIWYFDSEGFDQSVPVSVTGSYQPIVADFDQTGAVPTDDIVWYSSTAGESLWSGTANRSFVTRGLPAAPNKAQVLLGNFTPDSAVTAGREYLTLFQPDLFFYVPGTGADSLWSSTGNGTFTTSARTVNGNYTPIVGNFDKGTPGWAGGLTDIFWYAPGKAADSVWINKGTHFQGTAVTVNGTYKPFVVPGFLGPDTIMWNNPSGADAMWHPSGSSGNWNYSNKSWPGGEMGNRTPLVGYFDDGAGDQTKMTTLLATMMGFVDLAGPSDPERIYDFTTVEVPRADILWFHSGGASGQEERFVRMDGGMINFRQDLGEVEPPVML